MITPTTSSTCDHPDPSTNTSTSSTSSSIGRQKELHIAPMLHYTTREFRYLMRIFSKHLVLWTEMIVDETVQYATNLDEHLYTDDYDTCINSRRTTTNIDCPSTTSTTSSTTKGRVRTPEGGRRRSGEGEEVFSKTICQIGGNSSISCSMATNIAIQQYGYNEINLNIDCPSNRVCCQREFGAILMKKTKVAVSVLQGMYNEINKINNNNTTNTTIQSLDSSSSSSSKEKEKKYQISVKCRIGVDEYDTLQYMINFISTLQPYCTIFYLHSRKCILDGLVSARHNRTVPPLNYPRVYQLALLFPQCDFYINGNICTLQQAKEIAYGSLIVNNLSSYNVSNGITTIEQNDNNNHVSDDTDTDSDIGMTSMLHADDSSNNCYNQVPIQQLQDMDANQYNNINHCCYDPKHAVPCNICNVTYGSCIVSPYIAPANIRGCMIGRAVIDDPCIVYNVDRYFYNTTTNPCSNRQQVFDQYCSYLESIYPRRCCDIDDRITYEYPAPTIQLNDDEYCSICCELYNTINNNNTNNRQITTTDMKTDTITSLTTTNSTTETIRTTKEPNNSELCCINNNNNNVPKIKISSKIIGRSLKPVQGMFHNIPNYSRLFRRTCDMLGQDRTIRNCGPGFIIRKALQLSIPSHVLNEEFGFCL